MDKTNKTEDLVEKLIKKRKEETDAFKKLLNAIEQRDSKPDAKTKNNKNNTQSIL